MSKRNRHEARQNDRLSAAADAPAAEEQSHDARGREHETRVDEASEHHATHPQRPKSWVRPSNLTAPPPRSGMVQRWIRVSVRGADDPRNVAMRSREGWNPRPVDTIPEDFLILAPASHDTGRFVVDDLMLCEMPREVYEDRKAYYRSQTEGQMSAVEMDLDKAEQAGGQPIVRTHRSNVDHPARVVGRKVAAADDNW